MLKKKKKQLYPVSEVFDIYKIPSYNKEHLTIPDNSDEVYDYITRTTTDRGICEKTGFIDSEGMRLAHLVWVCCQWCSTTEKMIGTQDNS